MLSRRSRIAKHLTKTSSLASRLGGSLLGGVGKFVQKRPMVSIGALGGLAAGTAAAAEDIGKSQYGLSPQYLAARRAGHPVPKVETQYQPAILTSYVRERL
jgi:hypothetical protein